MTYRIIRFFQNDDISNEVISTGLSLEQAQAHCKSPDSKGDGWFDGYDEEPLAPLEALLGDLRNWLELTGDDFTEWQDSGLPADYARIELSDGTLRYFAVDHANEDR